MLCLLAMLDVWLLVRGFSGTVPERIEYVEPLTYGMKENKQQKNWKGRQRRLRQKTNTEKCDAVLIRIVPFSAGMYFIFSKCP